MRSPFAYSPRNGRLQRAGIPAAALFLGAPALTATFHPSPVVLAAALAAVIATGLAARCRAALAGALRIAVPLSLLVIAINGFVAGRGDTVLLRLGELPWPGRVDITLEALASGAVIAGRITIVVLAFAIWSAAVNPDRVLAALRPLARRSVLTTALAVRLVPAAVADAARLREAAGLRGPWAAPAGRIALLRRLLTGSLDRAVDAAAALELRGYSTAPGPRRSRRLAPPRRHSPRDGRFAAAGLIMLATAIVSSVTGAAGFEAYPRLTLATDSWALAAALAMPLVALVPFGTELLGARSRRGARRG